MEYNHITTFFDKFKKILSQGESSHVVIAEVMSKHLPFVVEGGDIKTKGSYIYLKSSPIARSEILMRKQLILSELLVLLPERRFIDIR